MRRRTLLALAAAIALTALAGPAIAHPATPASGSPVQDQLEDLFVLVGWMSVIISAVVIAAIAYVVVKYRGDPLVKTKGDWFTHNARLEVTWTVVTALILVFLGVVTAQTMDNIERPMPAEGEGEAIEVVAIGQQWQWEFAYPDGNTSENLHVQAGRTFNVNVISCDVIHSLYIPNFGVKIDTTVVPEGVCEAVRDNGTLPEGTNAASFWFRAKEPGRYGVQCAEYCGTAHAAMNAEVVAFEPGAREDPYGPPIDLGRIVHVEYTGSGSSLSVSPQTIQAVSGDLVTFKVHNNGTTNHDLTIDAPIDRSTGPVPPGETAELRRVTLDAAGDVAFYSSQGDDRARGLEGTISITAGEVVHVELTEWAIQDGTEFEAGQTYAFKVYNNGTTGHNLYIGVFAEDRDARDPVVGATETFGAGESTWLNVTMPDEDVTFQWWCDVPGHAGQGMLDDVTVGEGGDGAKQQGSKVLLPGWEVAIAVAAIGAAAWIHRRD